MKDQNVYRRIVGASAMLGGAQAINYLISLLRIKLTALLIGPGGVGMLGLLTSIVNVGAVLAGLGMSSAAVPALAQAKREAEPAEAKRLVATLLRMGWAAAVIGALVYFWVSDAVLRLLSIIPGASSNHAISVAAAIGLTVLYGIHVAILQGLGRIKALAAANVGSSLLGTVLMVLIYWRLGVDGLALSLLALAASQFLVSAISLKRHVALDWRLSAFDLGPMKSYFKQSGGMGLAFVWSALLLAILDLLIRREITQVLGINAAGQYHAAWSLSGLFAGFILTAMGTDFYPRLSGVIHERTAACLLINQQTEIGLLFAIPGVMITLVFSPLIVELAYSSKFAEASDLVPWFMIGVLGRVISWPLGFVQLAKRSVWWFFGTETAFVLLNLMCTYGAIPRFGVRGVAYANAVCYVVYIFVMRFAVGRMIDFSWQRSSQWVLVRGLTFVLVLIAAGYILQDGWLKNSVNLMVCGLGLVWVVFELSSRLGGGRLEFFRRLNILRKDES